ncbi:MAG: hypothetical protein HQM00_02305 [Magnetococcales bacterium]|nr:hypothetical protein [Magnetococcales bacterium]
MPVKLITNLSEHGIIVDRPAHTLPPNAFSGGMNVRFANGTAQKVPGYVGVLGTPNTAPWFLRYMYDQLLYAGAASVHTIKAGTHYDITRTAVEDDQVYDGSFSDPDSTRPWWTTGTGWSIGSGTATCDGSQTGSSALAQNVGVVNTESYTVTFTVSGHSAGAITPKLGGTAGTARSSNGTFTETIVAGSAGTSLVLEGDADFAGSVTDIRVTNNAPAYHATADQGWNGDALGGIGYLNNGIDAPQMWNPIIETTRLTNLTNWPAGMRVQALRFFKSILIGLHVTKGGVAYPQLMAWSDPAEPGQVPSSWAIDDPTKLSGQMTVDETGSALVEGQPLRDTFVIYKDDQIWGASFIGAPYIFQVAPIVKSVGVLTQNCVTMVDGTHYVMGRDDLYAFDGNSARSLLTGKNKSWFEQRVDPTHKDRSFVAANRTEREVWFCFPERGASWCTLALTYNYAFNTWGTRQLPNLSAMAEV